MGLKLYHTLDLAQTTCSLALRRNSTDLPTLDPQLVMRVIFTDLTTPNVDVHSIFMSPIVTQFSRLLVLSLCVLICHACSSSGGATDTSTLRSSESGPSTQPGGAAVTHGTAATGNVIPAVVGLPPDPGDAGTYRIAPHDLLEIEVFQVEDLSSAERVSEDGFVVISLIGPVKVGGLTPKEAEVKIADILGKSYLQDPQVNIFVKEYASQNVTVAGAVNKPGLFPLTGRMTLLQAVAMAEGVNNVANDEEIVVFRSQGGGAARAYVVNLDAIQKGKLADPVLVAEDRVIVPESGTKVFVQDLTGSLRGLISLNPLLY